MIAQSVVNDVVGAKSYRLDACLAAKLCLKFMSGKCRFKLTRTLNLYRQCFWGAIWVGRCKLLRNFPSDNFTIHIEERTGIGTSQCVVIYNCRTSLDLLEVFFIVLLQRLSFPFRFRVVFYLSFAGHISRLTRPNSFLNVSCMGLEYFYFRALLYVTFSLYRV